MQNKKNFLKSATKSRQAVGYSTNFLDGNSLGFPTSSQQSCEVLNPVGNKKTKKQIVFFCATTPYVMIYKIAREFKKKGYETVLITISPKETWEQSWYEDGFDKMICSDFRIIKPTLKNSFNMLKRTPYLIKTIYKMKKLKPYVVFTIARPNYMAALAMKFFKKYPCVYFPYDITSQQHFDLDVALKRGAKRYEINAERYCFENADGIMHKGAPEELEFLNGKTILGDNLEISSTRINFHPYCSDEFIVPMSSKLSEKDGEFHLVHVGGLDVTEEAFNIYKTLFQKLFDQKIHLHLYIKTQHLSKKEDSENFSKVEEFFKNNKYFHSEYSVDPKTLIKEISKYDLGISPTNPRVFKLDKNSLFCIGNRISTFFEAGISFIENPKRNFSYTLLKKYGLPSSFYVDTDCLDISYEKIKKINFKKLKQKILKARKDFNMAKHFPRLEKFVEKVVIQKNKK